MRISMIREDFQRMLEAESAGGIMNQEVVSHCSVMRTEAFR